MYEGGVEQVLAFAFLAADVITYAVVIILMSRLDVEKQRQEKHELRNWLFTQSDIYKRIIALSKQEVSDKKAMKVLTNAELKKLQKIIFEIYADYISYLQKKYPKLTEEDILYLCLNEAKLQPLTIALCFGYNNTHPINQRKLRIKERMKDEEM